MRAARSRRLGDPARRAWPALLGLGAAAGVALDLTRPGAEGPAGLAPVTATVTARPAERMLDRAFCDGHAGRLRADRPARGGRLAR